ncbi:hypothetical protein GVN20_01085 [Runella sp. CRIBMP]|uniref:Uncharacterized protein n=1 Tax=Runella salmonicolor TaxID=2950278 RepID=A0ABT1FP98_9BACT|nr:MULTISPECIES: hypothetical protein [Runella]MCP1383590.1 hypothetical protein [Runella salmonicolor]NBB17935.1 hypothetical protein [Runella sp. CRIBMP]
MESVKESIKMQFRKLWSLYLCRRQLCKQLEKEVFSDDRQAFVRHFYNETDLFLKEVSQFDWVRGHVCLPIVKDCKSLQDTDRQLLKTYTGLQADASWELEYPELARFLLRNLSRIRASLRLLRYLTPSGL